MKLSRYPLLRLFAGYITGVLLASFWEIPLGWSACILISSILVQCSIPLVPPRWTSSAWGLATFLVFIGLGLVLTHHHSEKHLPAHYLKHPKLNAYYHLRLLEPPLAKERSFKAKAQLLQQQTPGSGVIEPVSGKVLLYFEKDSAAAELQPGREILFKGRFQELVPPQNPYEFDYRNYLNLQAIYASAYVPKEDWHIIDVEPSVSVKQWGHQIRQYLMDLVDQWPLDAQEKAVSKALLLGYRYSIEGSLMQSYAAAGATHVLAVSGLHVGIVYLLTYYLLFFLKSVRYGAWMRTGILLLLLWGYALVTGLSPSVVRAATMFSFVALGTAFKRPTSIYNTLLASAMLLLLIKPTYLFEVGFQLSYLAVLGIVWLQPKIEMLWQPSSYVLRHIWTITTVSVAAQVATFPLGLFYFHQFPALFLVSNMVVIPLVTVLMYVGLVALGLATVGVMQNPLVSVFDALLRLMNGSVQWVEQWRWALIDQIHISRLELVLLYLGIGTGGYWLFQGKLVNLKLALGVVLSLLCLQLFENYKLHRSNTLTFYAVRKHSAASIVHGAEGLLVAGDSLLEDEDAMNFHIRHHLWARNCTRLTLINWREDHHNDHFCKKGRWLFHKGKIVERYTSLTGRHSQPDIWYVDTTYTLLPERVNYEPERIVLQAGLSREVRESWREWAFRHRVQLSPLSETGALTLL